MTEWLLPPRMPLGAPYWGVCEAGETEILPQPEALKEQCNFGNARGRCPHFPADGQFDTLSLTAWPERDGVIELQYIFESDYTPESHGRLRYCIETGALDWGEGGQPALSTPVASLPLEQSSQSPSRRVDSETVLRQVRAFLDNYLHHDR